MNFDDYRSIDAVNWSSLKHMERSPLHYLHSLTAEHEPSDAMIIGSAVHCAVLEPDAFVGRYAVWTGDRRVGNAWKDFQAEAEAAGQEILRQQDLDRVEEIAEAVHRNPVAFPYLTGPGDFERSLTWSDEATGLDCKGRVDRLAHNVPGMGCVLVDLKTTRDANPGVFGVQAAKMGYHRQLAFYRDGLTAVGVHVDKVVVILVESAAPYDSGVVVLDDDALWAGQADYRALLARVAACKESNHWPGRYEAEAALTLPAWAFSDPNADNDDPAFGLDMGEE